MDLHAMLGARGLVGPAMALLLTLAPSPASAAIGNWQGEGNAQVRLIAVGVDDNGRIAGGIEIAIDPGWKTYWRSPGDAGVAPLIDFSGSTNLDGPVVVEYPVPHRLDDGYAVTNVYENHVVLPLTAVAVDPKAETELVLSLDIGVCADICIPEHFDLTLALAPGESDESAGTILVDARRALPGRPEPGVFDVDSVSRVGGTDKRPVFEIHLVAPNAATAEIFVEGPVDWYPAMPTLISSDAAHATFSVEFNRLGSKTPIGGNTFTVTIVANGRAIEDTVALD